MATGETEIITITGITGITGTEITGIGITNDIMMMTAIAVTAMVVTMGLFPTVDIVD